MKNVMKDVNCAMPGDVQAERSFYSGKKCDYGNGAVDSAPDGSF